MQTNLKIKKRSSYKVVSNPLFKLNKTESNNIKKPIWDSFERLEKEIGTPTDWYNIYFRLQVGKYLIDNFYIQDTIDEFNAVVNTCASIQVPAPNREALIRQPTKDELEDLKVGIEAVDSLQDTHVRKEVLAAHYAAQKYLDNTLAKKK